MRAIDPSGVAGQEGSLRPGDQLLYANEHSLEGLTHRIASRIIRVSVRVRICVSFICMTILIWHMCMLCIIAVHIIICTQQCVITTILYHDTL